MKWLDRFFEQRTRGIAQRNGRRQFISSFGAFLTAGAAIPLLPVARAQASESEARVAAPEDVGDETSCDYWRYCAIDGFLCSCCGGSQTTCPPGTEVSTVTWIGTCHNPLEGKDYIISYNDCCGKTGCNRCFCNRNEGDRPIYQPARSNDINWCFGTSNIMYHCSTAVVLGQATAK